MRSLALRSGGVLVAVLVASLGVSASPTAIAPGNLNQLQWLANLSVPNGLVADIFFTPDSNTMITWNLDGEVLVWTRGTWAETSFLPVQAPITRIQAETHTGPMYYGGAALSPDGLLLATAPGSDSGTVVGRDLQGTEVFRFTYGAPVFNLAFSPDGRWLAVGGLRTSISLYDVQSKSLVAELTGSHEFVSGLAFTRDGSALVAAYERPSNVIKTWDLRTFAETASFTHATTRIDYHDLLLSPGDREAVVVTSEDGNIRFLDLATHQLTRVLTGSSPMLYRICLSPGNALLAAAGEETRIWSADMGADLGALAIGHETNAVAFSPDGTLLVLASWERGIEIWGIAAR